METFKPEIVSCVTFATMSETQQQQWMSRLENLFFRYGIKAVTMDDVAKELGISKKTLYQFVPSKKELVEKIVDNHIEMERCRNHKIRLGSADALDEMLGIIEANIADFRKMQSNIIFELQRHYRSSWNKFFEFSHSEVMNMVRKNLVRGQQEGIYRKEVNVEINARLHMAQAFTIFDDQWFPIGEIPLEKVMHEYFMMYLHGLLTTKGRELLKEKTA